MNTLYLHCVVVVCGTTYLQLRRNFVDGYRHWSMIGIHQPGTDWRRRKCLALFNQFLAVNSKHSHIQLHILLYTSVDRSSGLLIGVTTHLQEQCSKLPVPHQTRWTSQTPQHSLVLAPRREGRGSWKRPLEHRPRQWKFEGSWWPLSPPRHCWCWWTDPTQSVLGPPATRQSNLSQSATEVKTYIRIIYTHRKSLKCRLGVANT